MLTAFWTGITASVAAAAGGFAAAGEAGISLIYDGTALTDLGTVISIGAGAGLVLGVFYLIIRILPSARI